MKFNFTAENRRRGGVLAIALISAGFVSVGFAAWVGIIGQRANTGEVEEHAMRRRVAASNSRAVIREYVLERMITSSIDADGLDFAPNGMNGWIDASTAAWSGYPMESSTRLAGLNAFSMAFDYPYSKLITVNAGMKTLRSLEAGISDADRYGSSDSYLRAYVRSRSPILGGDLLVVHRSKLDTPVEPALTGNLKVYGRVVHHVPGLSASSYTVRSQSITTQPGVAVTISPQNLAGDPLLPSNLASTPVTYGRVGAATDYSGKLNVIDDAANGGNSLKTRITGIGSTIQNAGSAVHNDSRGYANPGTGIVTITPSTGPTVPDLPSVIINDEVSEIIIEGQVEPALSYARLRPAMAVTYIQAPASVTKLNTIRLRKQNNRRILLAIKQSGNSAGTAVNVIVEDSNPECVWNLVIVAENTPLNFSLTGGATHLKIFGGIQTDAPLTAPGGSSLLSLHLQADPRGLIRLAPRAAWVETIMPEKQPDSTVGNTW
jgi:hypothetical protein